MACECFPVYKRKGFTKLLAVIAQSMSGSIDDSAEIRQAPKRIAGLPNVVHTMIFGGGQGSTCTTTNLAHQRQYGEASETTVPLAPYDPAKSEIAADAAADATAAAPPPFEPKAALNSLNS